ncbi:hypothetical protein OA92_03880 [Marinomonas sp. SBI22]|uniref:hypothetical protein n=1 Tax=unclassified Marinomonas TaxID=196814 RepID=UPI0007AF5347|nr:MULTISPECIES: hypothetical protein [unclassified Marinomonas]KZM45005.1 hypothetical protein OA92_03880 [Marinomonas sp. SBI22]KZM46704.1 hypothetical protein OA91_02940 [Marinomonas sp. SBI8L]
MKSSSQHSKQPTTDYTATPENTYTSHTCTAKFISAGDQQKRPRNSGAFWFDNRELGALIDANFMASQ